jgi:3-methyladenine DNA glycosylase/8-oxoguanine DNA glycosylase
MPEKQIIDRDTYRAIKKMSREELQAFLMRYADGLLEKDGKSIDLREVEKDLRQIKGIGDKRVEEIMAVFEKHLGV